MLLNLADRFLSGKPYLHMVNRYPKTLVVIPALNEADSIAGVICCVRECAPWAEVLVINDGSSDDTGTIAEANGAVVLHMPHNVGIGASVQTGFMFADLNDYEVVIRNDGDGQHAPQDIPLMIEALLTGEADMIIGSRYIEDRGYVGSSARRAGSLILARLISSVTQQKFTDPTSGFVACNRRAIKLCAQVYPHDYPEPESIVLLHRAGIRLQEIPVTMKPREGGRSSITLLRSGYYMAKVILAILVGLLRPAPVLEGG
ncbi:MAG TPA: glycosyltransferase family 2 protein [Phototrophicaceae bacterium]|nr:glycosyltransferase family 2 protein [Phototrophicaceae bacterium]